LSVESQQLAVKLLYIRNRKQSIELAAIIFNMLVASNWHIIIVVIIIIIIIISYLPIAHNYCWCEANEEM
jgi:hypothetical protein